MERIILLCTNEGDAVFDSFTGTGTTMLAAKRLGRRYFGTELSQEYVDCANLLLEDQTISKINGIWVSCYLNKIYTVRNCDVMDDSKRFRPAWKELWDHWPETKEERRSVRDSELELKPEYLAEIKSICARTNP